MGVLHYRKGDYAQAALFYQQAMNIEQSLSPDETINFAINSLNLALAYKETEGIEQALKFFRQSLAIANANPLSPYAGVIRINCYQSMINCHLRLDQIDSASMISRKLVAMLPGNPTKQAVTYRRVAEIQFRKGNLDAALDTLQLALSHMEEKEQMEPEDANNYKLMGQILAGKGEFESALRQISRALSLLNQGEDSTNFDVYAYPDIEDLHKAYITVKTLHAKANALYHHYLSNKSKQELEAAFKGYELAVQLVDQLRTGFQSKGSRQVLHAQLKVMYEEAIATALELHKHTESTQYLEAAFRYAEKSKAALLLEEIRSSGASALVGVPEDLLQAEKQIRIDLAYYESKWKKAKEAADISRYQQQFFATKERYDALKTRLQQAYPQYFQLAYDTQVATLTDVQKSLLQSGSTILEYVEGEKHIYIFAIRPQHVKTYTLPRSDSYVQDILNLREGLTNPTFVLQDREQSWQLYAPAARRMYQLLMESVVSDLDGEAHHLQIIPDGTIGYVPFEVLLSQELPDEAGDFYNLSYLIHTYEFSYAYSASLMLESRSASALQLGKAKALGMAHSYQQADEHMLAYRGEALALRGELAPLPYAREEVDSMAQYFGGTFLFDDSASKEVFLKEAPKYRLIHLAMHGIPNKENPALSHLLFSADTSLPEYQTHLYAYELLGISLKADLVVLSACETGYGKLAEGEGIMSLARSFMQAGAKSIMMSLWKVSDKQSAEIMYTFYRSMVEESLPVHSALRKAKLSYLEQADARKAHPFFWAGFVGMGQQQEIGKQQGWGWIAGIGLILLIVTGFFLYRRVTS